MKHVNSFFTKLVCKYVGNIYTVLIKWIYKNVGNKYITCKYVG